jgi:hypothetical protein
VEVFYQNSGTICVDFDRIDHGIGEGSTDGTRVFWVRDTRSQASLHSVAVAKGV